MKNGNLKFKIIFLAIMFFGVFGRAESLQAACTGASPTWTSTPDYESVNACLTKATADDTINISVGSATWNNQLVITKSIILKGAGIGQTTIMGNLGLTYDSTTNIIRYAPSNPTLNEPFRITGFTFDMNNNSKGIILVCESETNPMTNIRIDHNEFKNIYSFTYPDMAIHGACYGVIDHNIFTGPHSHISFYGNQGNSWSNPPDGANTPYAFGTINNMYVEDNKFVSDYGWHAGGWGGRYSARYNSYTYTRADGAGLFPAFDAHGNQPMGVYAMMEVEIYGNTITATSILPGNSIRAFAHRGGKALFFNNLASGSTLTTTPHVQAFEEYDDAISPTTNTEPQHVNNSYYWSNWKGTNAFTLQIKNYVPGENCGNAVYPAGDCPSYLIKENTDFYNYKASFDGTIGVGCGMLASRPNTCTTGVGYWATNQSCTDLTGMVGSNPATPISGTLYKCTAPNTWATYYTPYTYPHPLRVSGLLADIPIDTTPPAPPSGLTVN